MFSNLSLVRQGDLVFVEKKKKNWGVNGTLILSLTWIVG